MWSIRVQLNQIYTALAKAVTNPMTANLNVGGFGLTNVASINGSPYVPSGGGVQSINGTNGVMTLNGSGDTSVGTVGNVITVSSPVLPALVNSVNSESGAIQIVAGNGIGVATGGDTITIANTNVISQYVSQLNSITNNSPITITAGTDMNVSTVGNIITLNNTKVGVDTVNSSTGAITLVGGTDISVNNVSGTITITGINKPVSNRTSSSTPVSISSTPVVLGTLNLVTTATYDVNAFSVVTFTTTSTQTPNVSLALFLSTNGGTYTQIGFTTTVTSINHSGLNPISQIVIQAGAFNVAGGSQNIQLRMNTNIPITIGAITMNNFQLLGNGNLA